MGVQDMTLNRDVSSAKTQEGSKCNTLTGQNAVMSNIIRQIRPVSFKYKNQADSKFNRYGFIAQELESVLSAVISPDKQSGMKAVNYNDMIAVLALGIQS